MTGIRRRPTELLAGIILSLLAGTAQAAGPSSPAQREAEEHDRRALEAIKRADAESARKEFAESYALVAAPKTLWNLLVAETDSNHPVDALKHLKSYMADPNADPKRKEQGRGLLAELSAQVGHVRITAPEGVPVTLDGAMVSAEERRDVIDVSAGRHGLEALFKSGSQRKNIDAPAGAETAVTFEAPPGERPAVAAPPAPVMQPQETAPNERDRGGSSSSTRRAVGFVVGGAGIVAIGAGVFFTLRALSLKSDSDREADTARDDFQHQSGDYNAQAAASKSDYDSAVSSRNIGLVAAGAGAVALGVGAWLVLGAKDAQHGGTGVLVVPQGTGARAIVRF